MSTASSAGTFEQALEARLRHEPGRPLVTFYDDRTGERTELSVTTYANWVAKTAGVLLDDVGLDEGSSVRLDLPTHWLGPVFLGAAWLVGVDVVGPQQHADLCVVGPAGPASDAGLGCEVLCCSLDPFAGPSRDPLPPRAQDFGTLWPGQPDAYLGPRARPGDGTWAGADWSRLRDRAAELGLRPGDRVLTDRNPVSAEGVLLAVAALLADGSVVWVADPDPARWDHRAATEHATRQVRASP